MVEACSSKDVVLVIMTGMADELIEWADSLSLEVGIFSEKDNLGPLSDSSSSSTIGAFCVGSGDKVGWDNISLMRPATSLLAPLVDGAIYDFLILEVLKTNEGWGMVVVSA